MKRVAMWSLLAVVLCVCLTAGGSLAAGSPNVVISQVYGGGGNSGAPYKNDFVELFNRGATAQSISGWSVQYASATGTGTFGSNAVTSLSGSIPAGGYYLVQLAAGTGTAPALPTPDATGSVNMSGTGGKVIVANTTTGLACNGSTAQPCTGSQLAQIVDLLGYDGANFYEGTAAAPALTNATAAFRANGGCTDTDQNSGDFTAAAPAPRNSASPANVCAGSSSPTVSGDSATADSGTPVTLTAHVSPGSNPTSTSLAVTGDLSSIGGSTSQAFTGDSSQSTFTYSTTIPAGTSAGTKSIPLTVTDHEGRTGSGTLTLNVTAPLTLTAIHDIQGAAHISPLVGQTVKTSGIVTATRTNGFNLQDPTPDANVATSEGIFVFTSSKPTVAIGDAATVTGKVAEFRAGGSSGAGNLTSTELDSPKISVQSSGNPLPKAIVIGVDRTPPANVIEDDATGDVETSGTFDPANDGIDFWESLEGMLVEFDDAVAVGPTNSFGETSIVSKQTVPGGRFTPRGGVIAQPNEFNPERVVVAGAIAGQPTMNVGDSYGGPLVGPLDYDFGNFFLEPKTTQTRVDGGLTQETTSLVGTQSGLTVATFNLENLAPGNPDSKFAGLADELVKNLKSPDIVAMEEVQDDTGATDHDGVVDSSLTLQKLHDAIIAARGPDYAFKWINPNADQDGGQPGGNIRVVFAYRTDVGGLSFAPGTAGTADQPEAVVGTGPATSLQYNPGRIDPASSAWDASRKPLVGEFRFNGLPVFVVANHWVAKLPDDPLMGHVQPPQEPSETQRVQQAQEVRDFVASLLAAKQNANVVVLGDLNDYQFSGSVHTLENDGMLHDLVDTLPANERYSYVYEGNSEVLDQTLVSDALFSRSPEYDVVHVNSEFADQKSDHEPQVTRLTLVTAQSLCSTISEWAKNGGEANSLCVKLRDDQIRAFDNEVEAQAGKSLTAEQAATLERLAGLLG